MIPATPDPTPARVRANPGAEPIAGKNIGGCCANAIRMARARRPYASTHEIVHYP